jgi:ribosome-associated protein
MNFPRIQNEVTFSAVRSRGPGGQNVNKVSSAAILYWSYLNSSALEENQKAMIFQKLSNLINKEDQIYIRSDEFRDLERNKERCLEKLKIFLTSAFHKPKKRKPTRPTKSSKIKRVESKTRRGETKKSRQRVW